MPSIVSIGIATMDIYISFGRMYPGGNELNVAFDVNELGGKAGFMGVFADDYLGKILEDTLLERGVDVSRSHHEHGSSGYALVEIINGDRVFTDWNKKGVTDLYPFTFTDEEIEYIKTFDIACTSAGGRVSADRIRKLHSCGVRVCYDFSDSFDIEIIEAIAPHISVAFLSCSDYSEEETKHFLHKVVSSGCGIAVATMAFLFYIQKPEDFIDYLTGLYNQNAFIKLMQYKFATETPYVCVAIIIDDIPFLSHTFGFAQVNRLYTDIADFLKHNFSGGMIYNLDRGLFAIVYKSLGESERQEIISKIQNRFRQPWIKDTVEIKLYSRLCIIDCPKDAQSAEDTLDIINFVTNDDRYKLGVVFAHEIDIEEKKRTAYIERVLRGGMSEGRFEVYYQPLYSIQKKRLIGAEALIRLRDANGDFISPEDFIPISEKNGTILRIGEFVFESVCKTLSSINTRELGIEKVDINLSVAQCMQEILADQILTIKSLYKLPSSIINLEITETAVAHTPAILLKNMERLSKAGIELSLDDYGSGYSNMNYLLSLPFKMVKIDKFIVWAAYKDKRAATALAYTIKMIKALEMSVLAEGVETKEQADWLTELGCDFLQGYYFAKPMPKADFLAVMKENSKNLTEEDKVPASENEFLKDIEDIDDVEDLEEI